jgi:hypothetical protein
MGTLLKWTFSRRKSHTKFAIMWQEVSDVLIELVEGTQGYGDF